MSDENGAGEVRYGSLQRKSTEAQRFSLGMLGIHSSIQSWVWGEGGRAEASRGSLDESPKNKGFRLRISVRYDRWERGSHNTHGVDSPIAPFTSDLPMRSSKLGRNDMFHQTIKNKKHANCIPQFFQ